MEGCRRSRCAGSDGHDGRRSRHASPGREGRSARVQLSVGQRGRLSNHLLKDERSEGASHEAPDGAARRALRPWRSSRRRRHDESGKADPGRRPRQAAGRRHVGGAGEDESRRDPREGTLPERLPAVAASEPSRRRHGLSPLPHRRGQEADGQGPDPLRPGLRHPRPVPPGVSGAHLPDDSPRPRGRLAGPAGDHRQLLRAVQRHPEPEAARGTATAAHAVCPAAVQPDGGSPQRASEPRRRVLRLSSERQYQRGGSPGRRHSSAGVSPSDRDADPARCEHSAALRVTAGAEDGRGLHRVRAAGRLLRRRPRDRHKERRQHARAGKSGPRHGRIPGDP